MPLSCWSYLLGAICLLSGGFVLAKSSVASRLVNALPRHAVSGYVLSTIAWVWAGYAVYTLDIDFLNPYKHIVLFAFMVCIPLTWFWLDNLLPCRALGGILTLVPYELLHVARVHPSPWRRVLVTLAYIAIIKGMIFLLYPWKMRQWIVWGTATPVRFRALGVLYLALGALLIALGAAVL